MSPTSSDLERLSIQRKDDAPKPGKPSPFDVGAPERRVGGGSRRGLWIGLAVLLVVLVGAWFLFGKRPPLVRTAPVEVSGGISGAGASGITANGYVVARTKASVAAKVAGRLAYLGVSEGSRVRKGEVMARIEGVDIAAAYDAARASEGEAKATLAQAQSDLTRAIALEARGVIAAVDLENARTRVATLDAAWRSAKAQTRLAGANLENTNVRAPFDGTVLRKDAEVGEIVAPSSAGGGLTRTAIVTMADLGTLEVEVDVNEAYIARVTSNQPARITLDAYPDTSFAGRVRQVVPTADRQKATVLVKVAIDDKDPRILPEMGARVDFVPAGQSAAQAAAPRRVFVPKAALVGADRVWIVADGKARLQSVTTGAQDGDRVEVKDGLAGDETLIISPPAGLKDGAAVRVAQP
ncbi:MAG: efflux RND transporter periplasmic adaptor subunit [Candidatus Eisenbacteria bacterium]